MFSRTRHVSHRSGGAARTTIAMMMRRLASEGFKNDPCSARRRYGTLYRDNIAENHIGSVEQSSATSRSSGEAPLSSLASQFHSFLDGESKNGNSSGTRTTPPSLLQPLSSSPSNSGISPFLTSLFTPVPVSSAGTIQAEKRSPHPPISELRPWKLFPHLEDAALHVESRVGVSARGMGHSTLPARDVATSTTAMERPYSQSHTGLADLLKTLHTRSTVKHRRAKQLQQRQKRESGSQETLEAVKQQDDDDAAREQQLRQILTDLLGERSATSHVGEELDNGESTHEESDASMEEEESSEEPVSSQKETAADRELEAMRTRLTANLRSLSGASAYSFFMTFETVVRLGMPQIALELFEQWWWRDNGGRNCLLFPIEFEKLDTSLSVRNEVHDMLERRQGEECDVRAVAIARASASVTYKKHLVSCALFPRVISVCVLFGTEEVQRRLLVLQIIQTAVRRGVCCSPLSDGSKAENWNVAGATAGAEKAEDWAVLTGVFAAAALLKKHVLVLRRSQRRSHSFASLPIRQFKPTSEANCMSYREAVSAVRREYESLMFDAFFKPCDPSHRLDEVSPLMQGGEIPGWVKLIFSTILDCYERSGALHPSPARRPLTTAPLWHSIHQRAIQTFPDVFHASSTVATLLCFGALYECGDRESNRRSTSTYTFSPSLATIPPTFAGHIETLEAWSAWEASSGQRSSDTRATVQSETPPTSDALLDALPRSSSPSKERSLSQLRHTLVSRYVCRRAAQDEQSEADSSHSLGPYSDGPSPSFVLSSSVPQTRSISVPSRSHQRDLRREAVKEWYNIPQEIFRQHAQLPVLQTNARETQRLAYDPFLHPQRKGDVSESELSESSTVFIREARLPNVYLFTLLLTTLAHVGYPRVWRRSEEQCMQNAFAIPVLDCVQQDIVPHCHRVLVGFLQKLSVTMLCRSGSFGLAALERKYDYLLYELEEPVALDRLLMALLWNGGLVAFTTDQSEVHPPSSSSSSPPLSSSDNSRELLALKDEREMSSSRNNSDSTPQMNVSTESPFGVGSAAWRLLWKNRTTLLKGRRNGARVRVLSYLLDLANELPPHTQVRLHGCLAVSEWTTNVYTLAEEGKEKQHEQDSPPGNANMTAFMQNLNGNYTFGVRHLYVSLVEVLWLILCASPTPSLPANEPKMEAEVRSDSEVPASTNESSNDDLPVKYPVNDVNLSKHTLDDTMNADYSPDECDSMDWDDDQSIQSNATKNPLDASRMSVTENDDENYGTDAESIAPKDAAENMKKSHDDVEEIRSVEESRYQILIVLMSTLNLYNGTPATKTLNVSNTASHETLAWHESERVMMILCHTCPDVDLVVALLLLSAAPLCRSERMHDDDAGNDVISNVPMSDRLLSTLCQVLLNSGFRRSDSSSKLRAYQVPDGTAAKKHHSQEEGSESSEAHANQLLACDPFARVRHLFCMYHANRVVNGSEELPLVLLAEIVDTLLGSRRWSTFASRNTNARLYCQQRGSLSREQRDILAGDRRPKRERGMLPTLVSSILHVESKSPRTRTRVESVLAGESLKE